MKQPSLGVIYVSRDKSGPYLWDTLVLCRAVSLGVVFPSLIDSIIVGNLPWRSQVRRHIVCNLPWPDNSVG
jgi:hypothetical protein